MAFGNNYSNNRKDNTDRSVTLYSDYTMSNAESNVDQTILRTRFWKGNLVFQISPRLKDGSEGVHYDKNAGATIYLSHTKARILHDEILAFLKDPVGHKSYGVDTNKAVINISNGAQYGVDNPVITIYTKAEDTGEVIGSYAYEIKQDYHYALRDYIGNGSDPIKIKSEYKNLEVYQILTLLEEFYKASTGASAFVSMNANSWTVNRVENKINGIAKSLGVDISSGGNNRGYSNSSYFDNISSDTDSGSSYSNDSVGYGTASIDDL